MIELLWNAPVSEAKMNKIIEATPLSRNQKVVDFGCGNGEVIIRLAERYGVNATGIDSSNVHIVEARRRGEDRVAASQVKFVEADANSYEVKAESLDLAVCMGASHAFGLGSNAYENALECMIPMVAPGGLILVAEGYLKQPTPIPYEEFIGDTMSDEQTHAANVATGTRLGLIPLAAWTSSNDEWDDFEWTYQRLVEQKATTNFDDEKATAKLAQRRAWMEGYLNWGRDTLGYGTYLFRKPSGR